jgi:hypothetical protein
MNKLIGLVLLLVCVSACAETTELSIYNSRLNKRPYREYMDNRFPTDTTATAPSDKIHREPITHTEVKIK